MRRPSASQVRPYALTVVAVAAALAARLALDPLLGNRQTFPTFFLAMAVVAWFGGLGPALAALSLGWLCADAFVMAPRAGLHVPVGADAVASATYLIVGLTVTALSGSMRRAEAKAAERARTTAALNRQLERHATEMRAFFDAAPVGIWIAQDPECRTVTGNTFANALLGVARGTNVSMSAPPGERAVVCAMMRKGSEISPHELPLQTATRTGRPVVDDEFDFVFPGGRTVSLAGGAVPLRDQGGRVQGGIAALIDVTEQNRSRCALEASDARMRAIIASASDAIITVDAAQTITVFNGAAERIFGWAAVEVLGLPLDRLIPERLRAAHRAHVAAFGETGVDTRTMGGERILVGLRRDGEEFPVEARISQAAVAGQRLYTVILRDVTERRRIEAERDELLAIAERARADAEGALRVVEQVQSITEVALADLPFDRALTELITRVRAALDGDTGVILLEEDGVLRVRAAVGLEADVLERVAVPVGRGFAGRIARERRPIVLNGVRYDEVVSEYIREKGIRALVGVPLVSGDGHVLGVLQVGSLRLRRFVDDDVRLLQLAAERVALWLEHARRVEAERRAHAEVEAASRAKDEFLAMLGHELRNPLAAVQSAIAAARLDEVRRPRAMEIAHRQAEQLGRLIDDLLDVARVTQGRIVLRKERVRLADVLQRAIEATRSLVEERRHTLSLALPSDDVLLEADPARMEQVVTNLLANAAKYTEPRGRIAVSAERQDETAMVRVRDSGIGIAPEVLPRVFDLFTQSDRALARSDGGLGVGLTVARRLVELHGGRIEARSDGVGRGAEFVVWLPALRPVVEEPAAPAAPPPPPGPRARVLIVEDNADAAESLAMLLELLGHHVRIVHDGAAALAEARADAPDVMLVDIGLPGMDGYAVARAIRDDAALGAITLVALTGYGREEDRLRTVAAGFDHHLVKPVDIDKLQGLVGTRVATRRQDPRRGPTLH